MFQLIRRTWHYAVAFLSGTLDTLADPRVQIEQAIEDAKRQHAALSEQAAAVIGNQRELQLKLARTVTELEAAKMQERVANALQRIGTFAPATDVPSLQEIRDRIDRRIARASGRYEIASEGVEARILDVEHAIADARGDELLEEIRQKVLARSNENRAGES